MEPAIQLEDIRKTYKPGLFRRPVAALTGLSLTVSPGEVHAVVGPNGAGKTTAFRILFGLIRADGGAGRLLGRPFGHPEALRRLGYLPESPCYYAYLSVAELLSLAARLSGVRESRSAVGVALERFDLTHLANRPLRRLSKGQLQRVGLAQAAVHEPDLLILDEPMSGLDPLRRAEVKAWIREMRQAGRTVLLASHVLADVEALADHVAILVGGRIVREGSAELLLHGADAGVEIEFTLPGNPRPLLEGIPHALEERTGVWAASLDTGADVPVHALLTRVLGHGGTVRSVTRRRRSLESVYLDSVRAQGETLGAEGGRR
jgi:ABC-2 type transport system ATP-binding protein